MLGGLALAFHAPWFVVSDSDGYYHLRHAQQYRELGLFHAGFPWAQASVVRTYGADLWYGFHLLLLPLTFADDLVFSLRAGALLLTVAALLVVHWSMRRLGVLYPLLFTLVFALASGEVMLRLTMLRPHPLSLALCLALFTFVVPHPTESDARRRRREAIGAAAVAFGLAWLHLALAWLGLVVLAVVSIVGWAMLRRTPSRRCVAAVLLGLVLGALLRPAPIDALGLAWVQVVDRQVLGHVGPLPGAMELQPLTIGLFLLQLTPFALLVLLLAALALRSSGADRPVAGADRTIAVATWSSLVLAILFLWIAFASAERASELFVGFGSIFVALRATGEIRTRNAGSAERVRFAGFEVASAVAVALFLITAGRSWALLRSYQQVVAYPFAPERLRESSAWLAKRARPGEIVFHVDWERFANLFFWNPSGRYINGMDPIFEYAYDPALTRAHAVLVADQPATFATAESRRAAGLAKALVPTLAEDFGASFVVLEKRRSKHLYRALLDELGRAPAFENDEEAVFALRAGPN